MNSEIERRRTFAIIAHPDAGKTSLTEKLLLFGGQIQVAGAVKSNKIKKTATSDWMDIEKQRGISVTTSVMEFDYNDYKINILDTPGHQDFAEDTYRTLTAVDSVIIVVDGAKGVETQTRKLMEVCRMRNTPVIIFVNKMDREAKDPFDLLDELEEELIINVRPLTWPIESGPRFKGVYNLYEHKLNLFQPSKQVVTEKVEVDINTEELDNQIGAPLAEKLRGELELVDGVYPEFNVEEYLKGEMATDMFRTVAELNVPYIMMHMQGTPQNMQQHPHYDDLLKEVFLYFAQKVQQLRDLGMKDIILDPGFGFGKTVEHNYELLAHLEEFRVFELPLLVGVSRKSMIYRLLGNTPQDALNGTTVLDTICLLKGADILRVHDVREAVETVKIVEAMRKNSDKVIE